MIIIYSDKVIKGINGVYISPRFFKVNELEKGAKCVYTNSKDIGEAYKAKGAEVKGFPRTTTAQTAEK